MPLRILLVQHWKSLFEVFIGAACVFVILVSNVLAQQPTTLQIDKMEVRLGMSKAQFTAIAPDDYLFFYSRFIDRAVREKGAYRKTAAYIGVRNARKGRSGCKTV
jgi:hypothetical protein